MSYALEKEKLQYRQTLVVSITAQISGRINWKPKQADDDLGFCDGEKFGFYDPTEKLTRGYTVC
jgi:hypothetical protein